MSMLTRRRLTFLGLSVLVLVVIPGYLHAYSLSGASDAPTLLLGDKVLVNQAAYWVKLPYTQVKLLHVAHPRRGDLVLVLPPDRQAPVFKRVIGLPEETIEMRDNHVVVNGQSLSLKVLSTDFSWVTASNRMGNTVYDEEGHWIAFTPGAGEHANLAPIRLKSAEYFLLGDNRDVSLDCREWGPLKEDAILGKVVFMVPSGPRNR